MTLQIEIGEEANGRWIAEVPALPGVMTYGVTRTDAVARVQALALRVLAERLEHGEAVSRRGHYGTRRRRAFHESARSRNPKPLGGTATIADNRPLDSLVLRPHVTGPLDRLVLRCPASRPPCCRELSS